MERFSTLQRYILRTALAVPRGEVGRELFSTYYQRQRQPILVDSITRALERLIDRGMMIGYGRRTPKKWFIERVRLTPLGRRTGKKLYGQQTKINW